MIKKALIAVLVILPLVFATLGLNFNRTWFSGDPEYAYLLNGVNIATLHSVGHTDNPGIPAQMYSAVVLRTAHFLNFSEKSDLQTDVLLHPDYYVELERKGLIVINALMMLILGVFSFLFLRNIWYSLILQSTLFISANLLETAFTKVSPEPVLIFTVMLLVLVILKHYSDPVRNSHRYPWIFGLLTGFGLATKATFLPLAFLPLFILSTRKDRLKYLSAIIPAFILFTIPAIPEYPHMAKWFLGLTTHTGTYGQGSSGLIDFGIYFKNIRAIIINNPALATTIILSGIIMIVKMIRNKKQGIPMQTALRFAAGISIVQILGVLMVAKHYHANHYLIPVTCLSGAVCVFLILLLKDQMSDGIPAWFKAIAPAFLLLFLLFGFSNRKYLLAANHGYSITNEEYTQVKNRLDTEFASYVKTYYYPISINPYSALLWGRVYSRDVHTEALRQLYPQGIFYDIRVPEFRFWEVPLSADALIQEYGSKILLVGGPMTQEERILVERGGLALKEIYKGRTQAIYEVDTANSQLFKGINQPPIWSITCTADSLSSDRKWFPVGKLRFQNSDNQTSQLSRSGKYSVKMTYRDSYALAVELDSIQPGQKYRISAWRKGGDGKAFVVTTSPRSEEFYKQNAEYLKIDEKGWKKVSIDFTIPLKYASATLKVYLWNSGDATAYFDDFTIVRIR